MADLVAIFAGDVVAGDRVQVLGRAALCEVLSTRVSGSWVTLDLEHGEIAVDANTPVNVAPNAELGES
jgi:hypothetical protein